MPLPANFEAHDRLNDAVNHAISREMPFANIFANSPSYEGQTDSKFNPQEWHEHFDDHADLFKPIPSENVRKSPAKGFKTSQRGQRQPTATRRDSLDADHIASGVRHVVPQTKAAAFQAGKLAPDFATQVNESRRRSKSEAVPINVHDRPTTDEMDVDSPAPPSTESPGQSDTGYNVTVEEEQSPRMSPHQHTHRHHTDPQGRLDGFDLNDLKTSMSNPQHGLKNLSDLNNTLPFKSQPASSAKEALSDPESFNATVRRLNLPHPPQPPHAPEHVDATSWGKYGDSMTQYMHEWNKFNATMIEHFRARQEAVTHGMYRNWVCAHGDGASASDFERGETKEKAGFATYVQWLGDDRTCRAWWELSIEQHRQAVEELGRIRSDVKGINARNQAV